MGWISSLFGKKKKTVNVAEQDRLITDATVLADRLVAASNDLRTVVQQMHREAGAQPPREKPNHV